MVLSPLNYRGTKRYALSHINVPPNELFVDVFGGSGTVVMNQKGVRIYNDINRRLVQFMIAVRDNPLKLYQRINLYLNGREEFARCLVSEDPAATFIQWNDSANHSGAHWGRVLFDKIKTRPIDRIFLASKALQGVECLNLDWKECFDKFDNATTVFYCDPPYNETKTDYGKVNHDSLVERIFKLQGAVLLSGYNYAAKDWDEVVEYKLNQGLNRGVERLWLKNSRPAMR